ncbi:MAG: Acyl-CoA synthetase family er 2 [Phenylobacterium sp.]|nr:Acyl-CoA synthetase family er 2 [Phenylobacterium sp.]
MSEGDALARSGYQRPATNTLPAFWRAAVDAHADMPALRWNGATVTFRDLDEQSAALARGLVNDGAGKGTRIGLLAPNGFDWVVGWLAINRIGALAVTLSTFFSAPELAYGLRHADVSILLTAERYLRHDYLARLEEAFPELAEARGAGPLALKECPFLRSIWTTGESGRGWVRGSFAELAGRGEHPPAAQLLERIEAMVSPADLALMIYTSGSTAAPKGVVHTQGSAVRKFLYMANGDGIIPANVRRGDRMIVTAPFFWIGGLLCLGGAMAHGASVISVDEHTPAALLSAVREHQATHLSGAESVLHSVREAPGFLAADFAHLKPLTVNQRPILTREPRERVPNSLGMTETFGPHSGDNLGGQLPQGAEGSVGAALDGVEYKIIDPETGAPAAPGAFGELYVRTPWTMDGMYKKERSEVFDCDGYYPTGDQCRLGEGGYLFYGARISGMIKTSGANVSPEEVERAILAMPEVIDAAVFGVSDSRAGEQVVAAVALRAKASLDEAELKRRLRAQLSSFKAPKQVWFLAYEDIPRTPSNKIQKHTLKARYLDAVTGDAEPAV